MASYYDDPEFYKSAFTKLVGLLEVRGLISSDKAAEYIHVMIGDGGVGVPFNVLVSDLLVLESTLTKEEYNLFTLLGELGDDAWGHPELIEALNTSSETTPRSG